MFYFIVFIAGVFAGGFGGYQYGAKVERAAQAKLAALANSVAKKVS